MRWPEDGRSERRLITLSPARVFRPFTLLLWGAAFESHIFSMKRNDETVFEYMEPGFSFEADVSWEEFQKLLDPRPDGHDAVGKLPAIGLYFPVDMPSLTPHDRLVVDMEGNYEHGVLIGFMPLLPGPEAKAA